MGTQLQSVRIQSILHMPMILFQQRSYPPILSVRFSACALFYIWSLLFIRRRRRQRRRNARWEMYVCVFAWTLPLINSARERARWILPSICRHRVATATADDADDDDTQFYFYGFYSLHRDVDSIHLCRKQMRTKRYTYMFVRFPLKLNNNENTGRSYLAVFTIWESLRSDAYVVDVVVIRVWRVTAIIGTHTLPATYLHTPMPSVHTIDRLPLRLCEWRSY